MDRYDRLTPSVASRALRVARVVSTDDDGLAVVERVLGQWARLVGDKPGKRPSKTLFADLDVSAIISVDSNPHRLVESLARTNGPVGALFYGPSGTGKTELAKLIAKKARRPLHERRPSDLLGSFVGESEQNVRAAFAYAEDEKAVLFIDEIESLLSERRLASHSWEVSTVNEMLMAMEGFEGVLICATNHPDRLDAAAFRRFTIKVRFDYLSGNQRDALLRHILERARIPGCPEVAARELRQLPPLGIGDFAAVERRISALGEVVDASEYVALLGKECQFRDGSRTSAVGFIH
jgi:SpoVK/Ycf46/Vps4 family AAA+-type ATPase